MENETFLDSLRIANYYDQPAIITFEENDYFEIKTNPQTIQPDEIGFIIFRLKPTTKAMMGEFVEKNKIIATIGSSTVQGTLILEGKIQEDFSHLTEAELKVSPLIHAENDFVNFGKAKVGEKHRFSIPVKNLGSKTLFIHKIVPGYGFRVESFLSQIGANQSGEIVLSIEPKFPLKKFTGNVKIYSNSPSKPELIIRLYGQIKK